MQAADRSSFKKLLADVMAFYRQDVSTFALSVWWQSCESFDLEQVRHAVTAHAMDPERGQFAPKPADIVRQLQGTHTDRSLIAWGKVLDAMQRVGAYRSVVFDDGLIHAAIEDMGGWVSVCRAKTDDLPFQQKRFTETYRAYAKRPDVRYPPRLAGEHEMQNSQLGFESAPPLLVGNPARAKQTMLTGIAGPKTAITALEAVPAIKRLGNAA